MLDYCVCPKCEKMIMLDGTAETGFCLYCGTHIAYDEARECFLSSLKSSLPDELTLETDLCELIDEDDAGDDSYGVAECQTECAAADEFMGKWDFSKAFERYTAALEWRPADFNASCGRLTSGILKLNDIENWEQRLADCIGLIRSDEQWNTAEKALEYSLDILKRFLSRGGRFVDAFLTYGFFEKLCNSFPLLRAQAAVIVAHCLNVDFAPLTDACRLDHETTRFAVGSYSAQSDKNLRRPLLIVMKYLESAQEKALLCRALYVYDRAVWLRNSDSAHIDDVISFMESVFDDSGYTADDRKTALSVGFDFLMMGALEQNSTQKEKLIFLSRIYTLEQLRRMNRFFSGSLLFNSVYSQVYLKQRRADASSAEYRQIAAKIKELQK